jgi:hypothetical protein
MRWIVKASKDSNTSLINNDTRDLQEAINKNWISFSTNYMTDCVYFVQAGVGGYIKIGRSVKSTGFNSRLIALQTSCPIPLRSLVELTYTEYDVYQNYGKKALNDYLIKKATPPEYIDYHVVNYNAINYPLMGERKQHTKSEIELERNLHAKFAEFCSMSEWFYPSKELLNFIYKLREAKITDDSTYNPKKAAIVPCIVCGKLTFSSTLKCRSHGSVNKYGMKAGTRRKYRCALCNEIIDTPKWKRTITCDSCYRLYVEETRKFHKEIFV